MHRVSVLHFLKNRELDELYATVAIRSFALAMINIFVPIYLLELNYTLQDVFIFYTVLSATHALFAIPAARISSKFGFKHAIFFSTLFIVPFYVLLYSLEFLSLHPMFLATLSGISSSLFWVGYHSDFAKFSDKKYRGEEIGLANIISFIFNVAGPLVGGLMLVFFGFSFLFAFVSLLLVLSVVPLFLSKDVHEPLNFSIRQIFSDQKAGEYVAFIGLGIEGAVAFVIWPMFIFIFVLKNFAVLGFIVSLSLVFSLIATLLIARFSDINRKLVLKVGSVASAITWLPKIFVRDILQLFFIDSLYGAARSAVSIPLDAACYDRANARSIVEFIVFREIIVQAARALFFAFMLYLYNLPASFIFASIASLLYIFF